jgi:hypothetical protein
MLDDGSITHREVSIEGLDRAKFLKFLRTDFFRMDWASYINIGTIPESLYWFDTDQKAWDESQIKIEVKTEEPKIKSPFKLMSS